ncbi:snare associated Golgi protein-domain-containing protein [Syncephalastrum racemosum]|uniref:Snare associated Golgi protein-domain-containing protein n=1 Tax=Syncephalastrum racemosum TaxID=13706 RepID=A0A1X2H9H9_SYNRA|nr:snare associated Golgi protein-domain-containing protein [Syncephalastrum racemosum]
MEEYKTDEVNEHKPCSSPWQRLLPRLLLFVAIGIVSLVISLSLARHVLDIDLPRTLDDVKDISVHLQAMSSESWQGYGSVAAVFTVLYLWQQAFSIPGSVLFNLLAGQMYGVSMGTLLTSLLTAGGATLAYGLAMLVAEPFLQLSWVSHRAMQMTRQMRREKSKSVSLFWWLLFARLFPFSPYWFINMVSPFLGVPVAPFFWSTFFGSMPYNFICAQAGSVLGELTSTADIVSVSLVFKLLAVSIVSLVPVLWGNQIQKATRRYLNLQEVHDDNDDDPDLEKANQVPLERITRS